MASKVNTTSSVQLFQLCKIKRRVLKMFWDAATTESSISEHLQQHLPLFVRLEGMAVTTLHLNIETEYNASTLLTGDIVDHIIIQNTEYKPNKERISKIKNNIKKERTEAEDTNLSRIRENICKDQIRANNNIQRPGCNNWFKISQLKNLITT